MKSYILVKPLLVFLMVAIVSCEPEDSSPAATYTLSTAASPTEGGKVTVTPASLTYNTGQSISLNAEPNPNWVFQKWEGDASGTSNPLTLTMNSDINLTGIFIKRDFPLNITIEGEGTVNEVIVTNPSGREYPHGTTVELTPVPADGWVFESWGGDLSGGEVPQRITVDGEKNVTAKFKINESNSVFYLAENGITCKCDQAISGDKGLIGSIEYEAVDNELLRQRRDEGADMTKLCTSLVTDMSKLFSLSNFNQAIGNWDVGYVTTMNEMFAGQFSGASTPFNQPIEDWDVGNVTDMGNMFRQSRFNQPIGNWDVSNVTKMYNMFYNSPFNRPIGDWDVSNVTEMGNMFWESPFNQPIGDWDVSNVTSMNRMFGSSQFNHPIGKWDVSKVRDMDAMFASSPFNQSIGDWDVSNVTSMSGIFLDSEFNQSVGDWDVSNVTNMSGMFQGSLFNHPIGNWDVSNVSEMGWMFAGSLFNQPIGNWDVSNVIDMNNIFWNSQFDQPIGDWDVSNVANMFGMFESSVFNQPIGEWNVINVTEMGWMFDNNSVFNQDLSTWCVINIPTSPDSFRSGATAWVLPEPIWGTCPE